MKKLLVLVLALSLVLGTTVCAFAEEADTAAETETVSPAEAIPGTYVACYDDLVTLLRIVSDNVQDGDTFEELVQAFNAMSKTGLYTFTDDGKVSAYIAGKGEEVLEGTYEADDTTITIKLDGEENTYDYTFSGGYLDLVNDEGVFSLGKVSYEDAEGYFSQLLYGVDGDVVLGDYSVIEIDKSAVEITDENIETSLANLYASYTFDEVINTDSAIEDGDLISISFVGYLDGEEEPFEGGSSDSTVLEIGSGSLIDDFEEQLIGHKVGEEVEVNVTFPEDYTNAPEYAGLDAKFVVNIN